MAAARKLLRTVLVKIEWRDNSFPPGRQPLADKSSRQPDDQSEEDITSRNSRADIDITGERKKHARRMTCVSGFSNIPRIFHGDAPVIEGAAPFCIFGRIQSDRSEYLTR